MPNQVTLPAIEFVDREAQRIRVRRVANTGMSAEFKDRLAERRERLAKQLAAEQSGTRYLPVLSVLAPVMTQSEGEITYPGDPMCLYSALSVAVHHAVHDAGPLESAEHYNDLAPEWTKFPDTAYRLAAGQEGYRPYGTDPNTDQTVYDPRVWDNASRARWRRSIAEVRPAVVLISSVSPAHRYALELAALAKAELPGVYVILGGRHVDETITAVPGRDMVVTAPSSTLTVMADGRVPRVVDALVRGEAYHSLDLLLRAVSLATDLDTRVVDPSLVGACVEELNRAEGPADGRSLIVLTSAEETWAYPQEGRPIDLTALPSPYEAFAIRSRFPIFLDAAGEVQRTAHVMVSNACPYSCNFCSETAKLSGGLKRFSRTSAGVERVCEYVRYGAESLFFDDSVFWSGNFRDIKAFCAELSAVRDGDDSDDSDDRGLLPGPGDRERMRALQWGAQLTVDTIAALRGPEEAASVLDAMREAGCTYVYIGIESMSTQVMDKIHKNLRRDEIRGWAGKVRAAVGLVKAAGLRVGTSVLFGLDGETRSSIDETIDGVGALIDDGLIDLASPNVLTYHPATPITRIHGMVDKLDYHSPNVDNRAPYIYFEEAFPGVVSTELTEDDLWYIHEQTERRWGGTRNQSAVPEEQVGQ
nr:radical SAM protein [Kibdelosporangium sp. MJ126-NF4]CEL16411.1 Radical SAM domain protein [Kibdelosporangium sp. MJ126-NF4]CTQ90363.1 Radical SAM domain protein [Kibdelosporangium sp. MJ126-NF4]